MKVKNIELQSIKLTGKAGLMPSFAFILYTPEIAKAVLKTCNSKNRVCPETLSNRIATDILNHNFALTHQGVAFDTQGSLIDGQNRLQGIVKSGKALVLGTFFNMPVKAHRIDTKGKLVPTALDLFTQDLVDHGKARSFADMLTFDQLSLGLPSEPAKNKVRSALVNMIIKLGIVTRGACPNAQLKQIYEIWKDDIEAVIQIRYTHRHGHLSRYNTNFILACVAFSRRHSPKKLDTLLDSIITGANLPPKHPALAFRDAIDAMHRNKGKLSKTTHTSRLIFGACAAQLAGKSVQNFNLKDDTERDIIKGAYRVILDKMEEITALPPAK
jgi:hypothetical protein